MLIPKFPLWTCALVFCGGVTLPAQDTPVQAAARVALQQKMNEPEATPADPTPAAPASAPAVEVTPAGAAPVAETPAVAAPVAPAAVVAPAPTAETPAAATPAPTATAPAPEAAASAAAPATTLPAGDTPAQAAARAAVLQKMQELGTAPAPVPQVPAPAAATTPAPETPAPAPAAASAPVAAETLPAGDTPAQATARAAVLQKMQELGTAPAPVPQAPAPAAATTPAPETPAPAPVQPVIGETETVNGGMIGVGTWKTTAEFKDIRVTAPDGTVLFDSNFSNGTEGWNLLGDSADWNVRDGALRQTAEGEFIRAIAGSRDWTDYTLTLKARKLSGEEGFLILFRIFGDNDRTWWNIGGWVNESDAVETAGNILDRKPGHIETDRWYDIKVVVNGNNVKCYLDGEVIHDVDCETGGKVTRRKAAAAPVAVTTPAPAPAAPPAAGEQVKPADAAHPGDTEVQAFARAALIQKLASLGTPADLTGTPAPAPVKPAIVAAPVKAKVKAKVKGLTPEPMVAPPLPIALSKSEKLNRLLNLYKTDQLTPQQYHEQRAAILAEP